MKKILSFLFITLVHFSTYAQSSLIKNINGYTLNDSAQLIHFVAIQFTEDKVDKLFTAKDTLPKQDIRIIDGQGKTLLPGLIDAHGHVLSYGLSLMRVNLNGAQSEQEAVQRAINFKKDNNDSKWLLGQGWNQVLWKNKQYPQAVSLDEYFKNTPVWFKRIDGHLGANAKAMQLAGIDHTSVSPDGGEIIKDANGNPTGVFIDNAMELITNNIPENSAKEMQLALVKSMKALAKFGLTSVHDAGIDTANIEAYKALVAENNMPIRINAMIDINDENLNSLLKQGHFRTPDDKFIINSVKISADGALGSRGAALIKDYSDLPHHKGLMLYNQETLTLLIKTAMDAGFQVNTHAIGDNANKIVLDQYEKYITTEKIKQMRHRIEHAQILRLQDISRFSELGVIASMQATHATSDKNMAQDRLGEERILGAYAWKKLIKAKAIIAGGSDFPVESANPFYGLHASVTRQDHQNQPESGWFPQEAMTIKQAFQTFTLNAAFAAHQENIIGTLGKNKKADFILIDQDIFNIKASELWKTQVLQTWVNGEQVNYL
ncbi:amidohydrolase family protein [Colwellia sp. MSW7]|uniref:Amidohydrolase family protein n=1 Tax=Colwellia maritima TaxID=2912588 RepID=A0ABS9X664_9GAMM|nr:amidohydrolase [Colwellia maritima]MCI2285570.1 amidohydrolase family protein [Colwellia maritima]